MFKKILALVFIFANSVAGAATLNIAVASNFSQPAKQLALKFEQQSGESVLISSGATGILAKQISNGAPYDIFFAADEATPTKLSEDGHAVAASRVTYAHGQLVLWSSQAGLADDKVLFSNKFKHLALANPKLAPYGAAAQQVIQKLGLTKQLQDKIIQGENISATYQYVASGNAELGFVALSQVYYNGKITSGSAWIIPANLTPLINQDGVITTNGEKNPAAAKFMIFLRSKAAQQIIQQYGYK